MNLLALSGSPSERSRSACLLQLAQTRINGLARQMSTIAVRELPAHALLAADVHHPALQHALSLVAHAHVVFVATPIYKAAYSGLLKVFLDLLPADARGKAVACAGSSMPAMLVGLARAGLPAHAACARLALSQKYEALRRAQGERGVGLGERGWGQSDR